MSSPESEFRQAVKRLAAAQDRKYQTKPGPPVQADVTDVNTETGYVTVQAQGQPAQIYVGATAAMYKSGDTLLVQQTNVDATHPEYTVAKPVKQDLVRTTFADPNPSLSTPAGFSVTSGTAQPTPGGYTAYADVSLHTVTSSYNYYAEGVTYFMVNLKLSTNLAWSAPFLIDLPATRPTGTLTAGITAGATSLSFTLAAGDVPPYRGRIQIEGEYLDYTSLSVSGSTYTLSGLSRGVDSTTAASHAAGTAVLFQSVFGRIEGLAVNRGYDFKVAAVKSGWIGPYSNIVSLTTAIDTTAPSTPTGIAVALQRSGAQVSWNPVSDADVGVGGYYTVYRNSSASESGATTHNVAATSYFWGNNDGSGWWFGVKAVDSAGNASGSSWAQDTLPPAAPSGLTVANKEGYVYVTWTNSTDASAAGTAVYSATDSSGTGTAIIGRVPLDGADFRYPMANNTSAYFNIKSYDMSGQVSSSYGGSWTQGVALYTRPLPAPTGLTATATTGGNLTARTVYFVVTALDGSGNESLRSTEVSCTVDGSTTNAMQLSWTAVANAYQYRLYQTSSSGTYTNAFAVQTATSYLWTNRFVPLDTVSPSDSQAIGGNIRSARAFPAAAAAGTLVFRVDLGNWYVYDGTRWMTPELTFMPVVSFTNTTTINVGFTYLVRQTYLTLWSFIVYVATTNNASNYWTITLTDGTNNFATFSTASGSPSVNIPFSATSFSPNPLGATNTIYIRLAPVGTPGAIDYYGAVRMREIAT